MKGESGVWRCWGFEAQLLAGQGYRAVVWMSLMSRLPWRCPLSCIPVYWLPGPPAFLQVTESTLIPLTEGDTGPSQKQPLAPTPLRTCVDLEGLGMKSNVVVGSPYLAFDRLVGIVSILHIPII
jgi:hypothetical protein